jgi:ribose transport system ATP-binding protein
MNKRTVNTPVLETKDVSKNFSGVYALQNVDMQIFPGEVHAVIGENGAGKSTLMKIISGVYTDYEGDLFLKGEKIAFKNPKEATDSGISIIHQELNLIPYLSITENLFLGKERTNRFGMLNYAGMNQVAKELLGRLQLDMNPSTPLYTLRVGQQQLIEIAKSLLNESKVLIMDEPTSAISDHEIELLFTMIRELKNKGVAIVYVSHKLHELFEIADRYTVLRDGRKIGSGFVKAVDHDRLIQMMVGRILSGQAYTSSSTRNEILKVENLCVQNPDNRSNYLVKNVSFSLSQGEVLGMAGLMGAGRTEVLESLFGLFPEYTSGKVYVEGKEILIKGVNDAIQAGLALVPEDRKLQGLILNMNVAKNTSLANLNAVSKYGFIKDKEEKKLSKKFMDKLRTQVPASNMEVEKLSGGNQQKVVIAKWLATHPKILLLDEPTRGIDVGAKAEIYDLIHELASQGMAILVVSSELSEIMAICDNILVMSESKLTAALTRKEATEETIMKAAISEKE